MFQSLGYDIYWDSNSYYISYTCEEYDVLIQLDNIHIDNKNSPLGKILGNILL